MHGTHSGSFNLNRLFKHLNNLFKLNNQQCDMAYRDGVVLFRFFDT